MNTTVVKAIHRFLICAVVITGVLSAVVLLAPEAAVAAPCCNACDLRLTTCLAGCGGLPSCEDRCFVRAETCFNNCIEC